MQDYDFTLKYRLPSTATASDALLEDLGAAGSTDALIGIGVNGSITFNFIREADCALDAITSALADINKAFPQAKLIEAGSDLVGLTEIGKVLRTSRQYVRVLWEKNRDSLPNPIHEGSTILWHLSSILIWASENSKTWTIDESLVEVAQTTM
ncbi:MAG: hypothetical protein ACI95C_001636 [Pseudohongiellaceae bacterium]|jgi:hypothetical protein